MSADLAERTARQTQRALASGTLGPIDTRATLVEDGGLPFVLRVVAGLRRKPAVAIGDPFAPPYEPDLFVADLSATHVALFHRGIQALLAVYRVSGAYF